MHIFDNGTESYKPRTGNLVKPDADLKIDSPPVDKRTYLMAMLTADLKVGNFFSPYGTQRNRRDAEQLIERFISYITNGEHWQLYTVYPDFLYNAVERHESQAEEQIHYFEGDYASDTATLITAGDRHFLLLTNGID